MHTAGSCHPGCSSDLLIMVFPWQHMPCYSLAHEEPSVKIRSYRCQGQACAESFQPKPVATFASLASPNCLWVNIFICQRGESFLLDFYRPRLSFPTEVMESCWGPEFILKLCGPLTLPEQWSQRFIAPALRCFFFG